MTPAAWVTERLASGLGRLPYAIEPRAHLAVNGDMSFSMRYPINKRGYDLLQEGHLICAEGQLYRIYRIKKSDKLAGREVRVDALHILYDLRKKEITNIETSETDPDGITQGAALALILTGTPFTVGTVDNTEILDYLDVLQKSSFWVLKEQVLKLWGGEIKPDNWTINIRTQIGIDRRYPIRRGKNLAGIDYTESIEDTITRLHVSGYGGATFESINGGKDYIDSPYIGNYHMPLEGRVEFPDDDLPADLMSKAQLHLPTVDVPQVEYSIDLLELKSSVQYALYKPLEEFGLGDSSVIHHDFFAVDIAARAMELDRELNMATGEWYNVNVVLGNYKKDLYKALSDATNAAEVIKAVTTPSGGVRAYRLQGAIDLMRVFLQMSASYQNAEVIEGKGMLFQNLDPDSSEYGAVYHGPGIVAFANTKNPDNSWHWRIGITPRGVLGEEVIIEASVGVHISVKDAYLELSGGLDNLNTEVATNLSLTSEAINASAARITTVESTLPGLAKQTDVSAKFAAAQLAADGLTVRVGTAESKVSGLESDTSDLKGFKTVQETTFRVVAEGAIVGKTGVPTSVLVAADRVAIRDQHNNEVTRITDNNMDIENASIRKQLAVGFVARVKLADGSCGDKWIG
jgi:phage minor structural protein